MRRLDAICGLAGLAAILAGCRRTKNNVGAHSNPERDTALKEKFDSTFEKMLKDFPATPKAPQ
jgi:hypothetical protein